jgi:tRNA (mo5U34)-methyltransferase
MTMGAQTKGTSSVRAEIESLAPWYHNIHLPCGELTAPNHFLGDFPAFKWNALRESIPEDLSGWTALDIGCNAGFYTFELARRGAQVTGVEVDPHYLRQARWVAEQTGLDDRVEFRQMQVYELAHTAETWDLVLFMGVFYHLRYPMLGMDIVTQKVRRMLVFQTLSVPGEEVIENTYDRSLNERDELREPGWPSMAFFEHRFAGDLTNWWAPNHAGVEAMIRSCGLRVTNRPDPEIYLAEPDPDRPSCMTTWNAAEYLAATDELHRRRDPHQPTGNGHNAVQSAANGHSGNSNGYGSSSNGRSAVSNKRE